MWTKKTKKGFAASVLALAVSVMAAHAFAGQAPAPVTGAIFTTNADGSFVNGNVYEFPDLPYLNGGPRPNAPCTAAGLPDDQYYFQITDPSGKELLSTDSILDRNVEVKNRVIAGPGKTGTHLMLPTGQCQSMTVELVPFLQTKNPGGEYKVWMTRVNDYGDPTNPLSSFGFFPSKSKTDNFKFLPCPDGTSFEPTTAVCVGPSDVPPSEVPPPDVLM